MRKQSVISVLILCACLGAFLLCCKKSQQGQPAEKVTASESKGIVISVNNTPRETDPNGLARWKKLVEAFERLHPDIKIESRQWDFSPVEFASRAAAGTLTDLVATWATEGEVVITQRLALDITDTLKAWDGFNDLREEVIAPFSRHGRIFAFPVSAYSMCLFYNKDLFRKAGLADEHGSVHAPQTWDEFVNYAKKLTDRERGVAGFGLMGENPRCGWHFLNWGWQAGGEFEKKVNGKWRAVFDSPQIVRALQFVKDLRWKHNVLQSDVLATYDDLWALFAADRVAMLIEPANPFALTALREKYGFDLNKVGIDLLPEGPGGRFVQMGADYYIFNPSLPPEKVRAAFAWCTFFVSPEFKEIDQKMLLEQNLVAGAPYLPIFKGERQKRLDQIIDRYRNVPKFEHYQAEIARYVHPEPPYYCQQLYSEVLTPAVQKVVTDRDAEPQKILSDYARMFQTRFLDKVTE
jgi:multiple sugar transport system substrate-binding protein